MGTKEDQMKAAIAAYYVKRILQFVAILAIVYFTYSDGLAGFMGGLVLFGIVSLSGHSPNNDLFQN